MWITEPIPLPVTALLGCGLCVLAGLGTMKSGFSAFSHPIFFVYRELFHFGSFDRTWFGSAIRQLAAFPKMGREQPNPDHDGVEFGGGGPVDVD